MDETKDKNYTSPDRLELLWLLLKKRRVDFAPQQVSDSESATNTVARESDEGPLEGHSEAPVSDGQAVKLD